LPIAAKDVQAANTPPKKIEPIQINDVPIKTNHNFF